MGCSAAAGKRPTVDVSISGIIGLGLQMRRQQRRQPSMLVRLEAQRIEHRLRVCREERPGAYACAHSTIVDDGRLPGPWPLLHAAGR